jgi:hypothetical protein
MPILLVRAGVASTVNSRKILIIEIGIGIGIGIEFRFNEAEKNSM